jgi:hypothetical protein
MRKYILLISLLSAIIFAADLKAQQWTDNLPKEKLQNGNLTFYEIQKAFNDYWAPFNVRNGYYKNEQGEEVKAQGWKQFRRWEYYWQDRIVKQTGEFPKTSASEEFAKYIRENPETDGPVGNWTSLGPTTSTGGYSGLGRINCVGFVSGDNNTIYVGSPSGGIWKTSDGGTNWTPIGDHNPVLGVSDIAAYRPVSAPDVIYIATGDKDGGSMWSLGGGQTHDNNSVGVLKSIDGGTTWTTTGLSFSVSVQRTVNRLLLHPTDNNILYAATTVGVYKTINGGTTWSLLVATEFIDMEFKPGTPSTIYASTKTGVIYRSTDSGSNWAATLNTNNKRTELAVSANNPAVVYAVVSNSSSGLAGIYKSTDSGATFSQVFSGATTNILNNGCGSAATGGQAWYDLCIAADPTNADIVFVGGVNTWKSINGGTAWSLSNHWTSSYGCGVPEVHADKHCLAYQNGTSTLFEGNDGGVYKTTNTGSTWTNLGNGLSISQIYRLGVAQTVANENIIGLQDNGTKSFLSGSWSDEIGGDGFECIIDYTNQNTLYGELYYGDIRRSTNHGTSWTQIISGLTGSAWWCAPFVIDPAVNTTIYMGYQDVFKSINQGTAWTKISTWGGDNLKALTVAPSNSNYIYAATASILYRTTVGGTTWTNITGTIPVGSGNITYIAVKNDDPNTVWVSLGGYNATRVYQTINGGTTWTDISAGLPSIPVMCLVQNKQNTSSVELYAGTDVGVYVKVGSANWTLFSAGLPNVVVNELEIYYNATSSNSRLRAATSGRGLWQSELYCVAAPVSVSVSPSGNTVCSGTSVTFTATPVNGGSTPAYQWQVNGSNAGTNSPTYTYTPLNNDVVTCILTSNASCITGSPATSTPVTMIVRPAFAAGTMGTSQVICYNTVPAGLTGVAPSGGVTPYSYQWQRSQDNVVFAIIPGATSLSYTPATMTSTLWYRIAQTSSSGCGSLNTNVVTITVNPQFAAGTITSNQSICYNTAPSPLAGIAPAGGVSPYSYQWQRSPDNVVFTTIGGATSLNYTPGALTATTYYKLTQNSSGGCGSLNTNVITITVNPQFAVGTITSNQSVCYNTVPSPLAGIAPAGGVSPYSYQWQRSPDNVVFTAIGGATSLSYTPGALTATTYYKLTQNSSGGCGSLNTNVVTITVNPPFAAGTITSDQTICTNTSPSSLSGSSPSGGVAPYSYQWQSSPNNSTWTNIPGASSQNYQPGALSATTYYKQIQTSLMGCGSVGTNVVTINVTPVPLASRTVTGVTVASGQSRCYDATQTVTVTGLLVNAGGTANILAGQNILLKPGTTVISGGYAHGFISTQCFWCSAYPNVNLPATTPDESDNQLIPEPMLVKQGGDSFRVYPNPTTGKFTVELPVMSETAVVKLEVYNLRGEKLFHNQYSGPGKHLVSLEGRPKGIYLVRVIGDGVSGYAKLIKE